MRHRERERGRKSRRVERRKERKRERGEEKRKAEKERGRELSSMGSTLIQIDGSLPPQTMEELLISREKKRWKRRPGQ